MCGIAGFVSKQLSQEQLEQMTNALEHRGPDSAGFFYDENQGIGLGHRRLSIIDLSSGANQPFFSNCGRYVMVFNGEVYNFLELTKAYGLTPRTSSDTEVVLELFIRLGHGAFSLLNGMFAIAIWDKEQQELTIARDRIGKKPMYLYKKDGILAFSSELKSFKRAKFPLETNQSAIADFLYLGYFPGKESIYSHVEKLMPGHWGLYKNGILNTSPFWSLREKLASEPTRYATEAEAKKEVKKILETSVAYRLIADVPLGSFLSGGIDSSLVTALAQQVKGSPVKTFSIGFKEAKHNESDYAREVAKTIGTEHHEFILSTSDAQEKVAQLTDVYDEPFADSSGIPTLLVSEMARKHVTVALSGDGGDELFHGYGMYTWAQRLNNPLIAGFRKPLSWALKSTGKAAYRKAAEILDFPSESRLKSHIFSQEQHFFSEMELQSLIKGKSKSPLLDESQNGLNRTLTPQESQALFDLENYLPDMLLIKVDRASMKHSLEVRCPLLDYRLIEFAVNLPQTLKIKDGTQKYLLKETLYDIVPRSLFERPKWGFSIPLKEWLLTDLRYLIDEVLSVPNVDDAGFVHTQLVEEYKKRFFAGEHHLYNRLWVLICLHKWHAENQL